jgi:hypothetical protein
VCRNSINHPHLVPDTPKGSHMPLNSKVSVVEFLQRINLYNPARIDQGQLPAVLAMTICFLSSTAPVFRFNGHYSFPPFSVLLTCQVVNLSKMP